MQARSTPQTLKADYFTYAVLAGIVLSVCGSVGLREPLLLALPIFVLGIALVIYEFKWLMVGYFALLPFSTELFLPNGFGIYVLSEPLMLAMTGLGLLISLFTIENRNLKILHHPITWVIMIHLIWIGFTTLLSSAPAISIKFFLAKFWFFIPFYFMWQYWMPDETRIRKALWFLVLALTLSVSWVLIKYIPYGFAFKDIERVVKPFFRNHVDYASIMALSIPIVWYLMRRSNGVIKLGTMAIMGFMLFAIYFSYTRAAMAIVLMLPFVYLIIRWKLVKHVVLAGLAVAVLATAFLVSDRNYLNFSPDFEKTVTHRKFDDLVSATYKLEDISTMERVYRWVAAGHMIGERPFIGFGPSTFSHVYRPYTVSDFETYVSDNPEKSGIHSYYLMTWVDQGTPGLLILLLMVILPLIYGERLYHRLKDPVYKDLVLMALLLLLIVDVLQVINDLLETDKVGPFFLAAMAIIVWLDQKVQQINNPQEMS